MYLLVVVVILVAFSALFSGLTLGLMSLDPSGLEIVMASDDPRMARAAGLWASGPAHRPKGL